MEERSGVCWVLVGNLKEGGHFGHPDVDGWIRLRWVFGKWDVGMDESNWLRTGTGGGHL
jgi:hypothetical protein